MSQLLFLFSLRAQTNTFLEHSHKKQKDSLETWVVLLVILLKFEKFGVAVQSIHQNSENW